MNNQDQVKKEFSEHVRTNMRRAYFIALGFLGSYDDAIEASQLAFVKAYRNYKNFDKNKAFFTWYYKILKNVCLNIIRYKKRTVSIDIFDPEQTELLVDTIVEELEFDDLKEKLARALFRLNPVERSLIILKEYEKMSYNEISEILELPIGTVMSKLFYARKKLSNDLRNLL